MSRVTHHPDTASAPSRSLVLLGVDFTTAPLAVRERLRYDDTEARRLLAEARDVPGVREATVVSTCNRTEFYLVADEGDESAVAAAWLQWLRRDRPDARLMEGGCALLQATSDEAVAHLFRVGAGLESAILGDVHIAGQLKRAFAVAEAARCVGPVLSQLFSRTFQVIKRARAETSIGTGHASLGSAIAAIVAARASGAPSVLVVGAGVAARDTARHLAKRTAARLTVINRTVDRAAAVAASCGGSARPWADLAQAFADADVVVTCAAGGALADLGPALAGPRLIIDTGVPRNLPWLSGPAVLTIDDIAARRDDALAARQRAVPAVEALVADALARWRNWRATQPRERLLRELFRAEARSRGELAARLVATGFPGGREELDRILRRTWAPMLYRHARGLRDSHGADTGS